MRCEQSTLSRAVEALVQGGLVRREPDAEDNRAMRVFLTDAGREANERLWPLMVVANGSMFKGISNEEQRAFTATLQKMLRNIRKHNF